MRAAAPRLLPLALGAALAAAGCSPATVPAAVTGGEAGPAAAARSAAPSAFAPPPTLADSAPEPGTAVYDLTAAAQRVELAPGRFAEMAVYNGAYPGPTIDVREGDEVVVRFHNALAEPTSVHWHGLAIPADQDDALETIAPGARREFRFTIPRGSAGTYWYHPHLHGAVARQVSRGLFGAVRVRAADDPLPAALGDDIAFLSDPRVGADGQIAAPGGTMDWAGGVEGEPRVNGRVAPRLTLQPGEARRVRFINASTARYYRLQLPAQALTQVGSDGGLLERPVEVPDVLLAPGERAELVLRAPERAGDTLALRAAPYDRGGMGAMMSHAGSSAPTTAPAGDHHGHGGAHYALGQVSPGPGDVMPGHAAAPAGAGVDSLLLELAAAGLPAPAPALPAQLRTIAPFATAGATARSFTLTEDHATADFRINGQAFDAGRIDVTTKLGASEVWTLVNQGDMDHPFHLHGFGFQVLDRDGVPEPLRAWKDTVNLRQGETVRVGVKFDGHPGVRVYHCHILEHEDRGMMGLLRVD